MTKSASSKTLILLQTTGSKCKLCLIVETGKIKELKVVSCQFQMEI